MNPASIAAPISGLACNTSYTFYAIGNNSAGTNIGSFFRFRTWPCSSSPPVITSESVDSITQTSAVFHGAAIPNGIDTFVRVEYGTNQSTSLIGIPPPAISIGSGTSAVPFSVGASDLTCGTTYFYYVMAVNSVTGTGGNVLSFTTQPCATSSPATSFYTLTPCRIFDTRNPGYFAIGAASGVVVPMVMGTCGVPSTAKAVALNVTAVNPTATGSLTVFPATGVPPSTSTVAVRPGTTRAASTIVGLSSGGTVTVFNSMASGQSDFILDVTGYFQ
ncbi:MAG: hypothetical protein WAM82_26215 [Thermoanaerobaculia bacterium]